MKRNKISVRQQGDIVELKLYSTYEGKRTYFEGKARLNNKKELKTLFSSACSKGLDIPETSWFD